MCGNIFVKYLEHFLDIFQSMRFANQTAGIVIMARRLSISQCRCAQTENYRKNIDTSVKFPHLI